MAKGTTSETGELLALASSVADDAKKLLGQQLDLFRAEAGEELRRASGAALAMAGGGGLVAASGLLSGLALAHLVHKSTRLPLWASYGLLAVAAGAGAAALVGRGRAELAAVRLLPKTTDARGENLEWLRDQMTPASA